MAEQEGATASTAMLVPSQAISGTNNNNENKRNHRKRNNRKNSANDPPNGESQAAVLPSNVDQNANEGTAPKPKGKTNTSTRNRNKAKNENKGTKSQNNGSTEQTTTNTKVPPRNQPAKKNNRSKGKTRYPWRKSVPSGSVDPITLDPLVSLSYPPFALCADSPYVPVVEWPVVDKEVEKKHNEVEDERQRRLLQEQWGSVPIISKPDPQLKERPLSKRTFNLFDGRALAYYMVSQQQFIDPLNRRDLTRDELVNLNHYLKRHGFNDLDVTEAYDSKGITVSTAGATASTDAGRALIRQQEAQLLAQSLLDNVFAGNRSARIQPRNPLQAQYAASQRRQDTTNQQNQSRYQRPTIDSGVYGSEEQGLVVIDDDANPGLRGGVPQPSNGALMAEAATFHPGTLWSASHITNGFNSQSGPVQPLDFPALSAARTTTRAADTSLPATNTQQPIPSSKGASRSLSRITKVVAKTDPKLQQKQREARELFVKRAALSSMDFTTKLSQETTHDLPTPTPPASTNIISESQLLRNQAFASALGVVPSTMRPQASFHQGWARPVETAPVLDEFGNELNTVRYPDSLIIQAREKMTMLLKLEKKWSAFLADDTAASLPLKKMNRELRKFVHEYSDHWKLHTESFDPEPNRYIHCVKMHDTSAPRPLLSEAVRTWRGPQPILSSASDTASRPMTQPTFSEIGPPGVHEPLQLRSFPHPGFDGSVTAPGEGLGNARSDEFLMRRERPKLDLNPRTLPLELAPMEKTISVAEERERHNMIHAEKIRLQRQEEETKRQLLESAFASESDEASLKSHDSADWDDNDDQEAVYSGSDEEG